MRVLALITIFLFCAFSYTYCFAEPYADDLQKLEREISKYKNSQNLTKKQAELAGLEILEAQKKTVIAAAAVLEYEASLDELEKEREELEKKQKTLKESLDKKTMQMQNLLAALEILAYRPTEALFAVPLAPDDMVKSSVLMASVVPQLQKMAATLKVELAKLSSLKMAIKSKEAQIKTAQKGLEEKKVNLDRLVELKQKEQKKYLNMHKKVSNKLQELAKKAENIEDLLKQIETKKREEVKKEQEKMAAPEFDEAYSISYAVRNVQASVSFENAKGTLAFPVTGSVDAKFGEINQNGMHNQGIVIKTRKKAMVISPFDGKIQYAGVLKGYGNLIIIEHNEGYYTLLAGMEQKNVQEGQYVLAGEPIGVMENTNFPKLYMEIRKNDKPINPLPWLALKS